MPGPIEIRQTLRDSYSRLNAGSDLLFQASDESVSGNRTIASMPPVPYQAFTAFRLNQQIRAVLFWDGALNLAYHFRCIQGVDLIPKSTQLEKPGIGHHVLKAQVGKPSQL